MKVFNRLTTTAFELQELLSTGKSSSSEAVNAYLEQLDIHNNWLKAVIATPPRDRLRAHAKRLDDERQAGKVRGPLHGIPILVKDSIDTPTLEVATTGGCVSLVGAKAKQDAEVIQRLLRAGVIVLGKANLSELNFWKGSGLPCGWSAVGGQTQSPYVPGGFVEDGSFASHSNCGGSSSGSAVGVAAGFVPISIGTETAGSLNMPATRAALYTIKPTVGIVPGAGIIPVSPFADSAGPMAKCARDIADLLDVLVDETKTTVPKGGYKSCAYASLADIGIGALDPELWKHAPHVTTPNEGATKQMIHDINEAYRKIQPLARRLVHKLPFISIAEVEQEDKDVPGLLDCLHAQFKPAIESYLQALETSPVRTLKELVERNRVVAGELPPGRSQQDILEKDLGFTLNKLTPEEAAASARTRARRRIDDTLTKHEIDIMIGPADSPMPGFAAAAGYPLATLPIGVLNFNGRPFGLTAITKAHGEPLLIRLQAVWEKLFPRSLPQTLVEVGGK